MRILALLLIVAGSIGIARADDPVSGFGCVDQTTGRYVLCPDTAGNDTVMRKMVNSVLQRMPLNVPNGIISLDASGNVTAPINTSIVRVVSGSGNGINFINPSPTNSDGVFHADFSANINELTFWEDAPGSNVFVIWNKSLTGFSAETWRGYDPDMDSQFEHLAQGYFPGLTISGLYGYSGIEVSSFDTYGNALEPASAYVHQETGAHFTNAYQTITGVVSGTTVTAVSGTFPDGINGYVIQAPGILGQFHKTTTITAGAGTSTLTLSKAAVFGSQDSTNGQPLHIGPTIYSQTDWEIEDPMGAVQDYRFDLLHDNNFVNDPDTDTTPLPFFVRDRASGRSGTNTIDPQGDFDNVGTMISGSGAKGRQGNDIALRAACDLGAYTACVTGGNASTASTAYAVHDVANAVGTKTYSTGTALKTVTEGGTAVNSILYSNGYTGYGSDTPVNRLDVVGQATFGTNLTQRSDFGARGIVNIVVTPGTAVQNVASSIFAPGDNTAQWLWNTEPSRLTLYDLNARLNVISLHMDGTGNVDVGGTLTAGSLILPFGTPTSSTASCTQGQVEIDAEYTYTCVATNTWHRSSNGATW